MGSGAPACCLLRSVLNGGRVRKVTPLTGLVGSLHWLSLGLSSAAPMWVGMGDSPPLGSAEQHAGAYLVDRKADRVHVSPHLPLLPPVLLHQGHQETAGYLIVLGVIVLLQELDLELGVNPERGCRKEEAG